MYLFFNKGPQLYMIYATFFSFFKSFKSQHFIINSNSNGTIYGWCQCKIFLMRCNQHFIKKICFLNVEDSLIIKFIVLKSHSFIIHAVGCGKFLPDTFYKVNGLNCLFKGNLQLLTVHNNCTVPAIGCLVVTN